LIDGVKTLYYRFWAV